MTRNVGSVRKPPPPPLEAQGLWEFSLSVYPRPEVEQACLSLQDRLGVDINMLLASLWLGVSGRGRLQEEQVHDLQGQVAFWQAQVIGPLRQVRRHLKDLARFGGERFALVRKSVAGCELQAEQVEQQMLEQALSYHLPDTTQTPLQRLYAAAYNLRLLLAVYPGGEQEGWRRIQCLLLQAVFPQHTKEEVLAALAAH